MNGEGRDVSIPPFFLFVINILLRALSFINFKELYIKGQVFVS